VKTLYFHGLNSHPVPEKPETLKKKKQNQIAVGHFPELFITRQE
jgi:hypothetical protein